MNTPANRIELDNQGNIVIVFPPDIGKHQQAKEITSAVYDKKHNRWVVPKQYLLAVLNTFPGFATSSDIQKLVKDFNDGETLSNNKASSIIYAKDITVVNGRKLFKHQIAGVYAILKQKRIILSDEMGLGKGQKLNAKILQPSGWTTMGELVVGDEVINSLGEATKIVGVFPQGMKDIYKISFSDGTSTECDENHLWSVQSTSHRFRKQGFLVKSLKELNSTPLHYNNGNAKWYIPIAAPIQAFSKKDLSIAPYLLGLLLGDGGLTTSGVSFASADEEIVSFVKNSILPLKLKEHSKFSYRLSKEKSTKPNHLIVKLKDLGLMGHGAATKFIPQQYLFSSIEDRLAILQGLMDTDGSIITKTKQIEFCSISKQLVDGLTFIVQSLGGNTTIKERYTYYTYKGEKKKGKLSYRVNIFLPNEFNPFRLTRKAKQVTTRTKYFPSRNISKIEYVGKEKTQCIKVASEDAMYLTNECIVTHNTTTALVAGSLSGLPMWVVAPKNLQVAWEREAAILGIPVKHIISWAKIPAAPSEDFFCIMDEAQAMQSFNKQRTQKALSFCNNARYVVCVTGTPAKNGKPSNMFGMLCAVKHPESFKKVVYDREYSRASNLPKLYQATKGSILFRKKEDCIDLPPKIRTLRVAELTPDATTTYENAYNTFRNKWKLKVDRGEIISSNEKLVMFMQLRHAASWAKLYSAIEAAEELNDNNKQAVFFVNFTDTADAFMEAVSKFATIGKLTGDVNQETRQRAIDGFQAGNIRYLVCTYGVGGTGITLTAAHHVILIDRAWTPGDCVQSEDRLHRIGQKDTVLVDWIQCGNVDQKIDALLLRKQGNISTIMTGNKDELPLNFDIRNSVDDILNEVFK